MEQLEVKRAGEWPRAEREFLRDHPTCAWCGAPASVAHHIRPVAYYPELELDPTNLQATCGADGPCHLWGGHCGSWRTWNPHAREDAALMLQRRQERKTGRID